MIKVKKGKGEQGEYKRRGGWCLECNDIRNKTGGRGHTKGEIAGRRAGAAARERENEGDEKGEASGRQMKGDREREGEGS